MPKSKPTYGLTAHYIEFIHDRGVALTWPGLEPVYEYECLDRNLLEAAAVQPFQAGYGVDFYPTVVDKAAYLFFSIAGGHIFRNGNKRTAVLALDQFLNANAHYLLLSNEEVKNLAEDTASYNENGETKDFALARIRKAIGEHVVEFRHFRKRDPAAYRGMHATKNSIRECGGAIAYPTD